MGTASSLKEHSSQSLMMEYFSDEYIRIFVVKKTSVRNVQDQHQPLKIQCNGMEIKKSPEADLEKGKGLSLLLGLVVALSLTFVGLEWRSSTAQAGNLDGANHKTEMEEALLVKDEQPEDKPEDPKPQEQPQQTEIQLPDEFKVVSNDVKVEKPSFVSADENKDLPPINVPFGPKDVPGTPTEELSDEPFEVVEEQPEFPGGMDAFRRYLQDHLRYPESAQDAGIQGKVIVRFVVERDGSATAVEVFKGVDPALDKEAVRVVKSIPKWKPGKQQGKPVRTRYVIPIVFSLQ